MHLTAHATKIPGLIFLSGQTPVDKSGTLVEGGIKEHTVCFESTFSLLADLSTTLGAMYQKPRQRARGGRIELGEGR